MRHFLFTKINAFTDVTYLHLAIGIIVVAAIVGYVAYNVIKAEKGLVK